MTEPIVTRTLENYAQRSGPMPVNMLAVVERGYRRRRAHQRIASAAAGFAVVAVITAVVVVNPLRGTSGHHIPSAGPTAVSVAPTAVASPSPAASIPSAPTSPKPPIKPLTCPIVTGKPQTAAHVLSLLTAASQINEYKVAAVDPMTLDSRLHQTLPDVHIPLPMLKAIAANASSWTSTCISADGSVYGTMQVSADVADFVNQKFTTGLDRYDQAANVKLGNAYLEYLTVHFGVLYFQNDFDLTTNIALRDTVIAAYDVGISAVDPTGSKIAIGPVGQAYVTTIVALMNPANVVQKTWGR